MPGIAHAFTNPKADGADTTVVRPSDWNAAHLIDGLKFGAGTSFPGSPATNDLYLRTDRGLQYYYDGTRWVTVTLYRETVGIGNVVTPATVSDSNVSRWTPWGTTWDLYLDALYTSTFPATTNTGAAFHTLTLAKVDTTDTPTTVASFDTSADTVNNWTQHRVAIGAVYTAASFKNFALTRSSTGVPGSIYWSAAISYRLIG